MFPSLLNSFRREKPHTHIFYPLLGCRAYTNVISNVSGFILYIFFGYERRNLFFFFLSFVEGKIEMKMFRLFFYWWRGRRENLRTHIRWKSLTKRLRPTKNLHTFSLQDSWDLFSEGNKKTIEHEERQKTLKKWTVKLSPHSLDPVSFTEHRLYYSLWLDVNVNWWGNGISWNSVCG